MHVIQGQSLESRLSQYRFFVSNLISRQSRPGPHYRTGPKGSCLCFCTRFCTWMAWASESCSLISELFPHSKNKKYFSAPFLVLQLATNRGLVPATIIWKSHNWNIFRQPGPQYFYSGPSKYWNASPVCDKLKHQKRCSKLLLFLGCQQFLKVLMDWYKFFPNIFILFSESWLKITSLH